MLIFFDFFGRKLVFVSFGSFCLKTESKGQCLSSVKKSTHILCSKHFFLCKETNCKFANKKEWVSYNLKKIKQLLKSLVCWEGGAFKILGVPGF
jgi:hypothetical protein